MKPSLGLDAVIASPIGKIGIKTEDEFLVGIHFLSSEAEVSKPRSPLSKEVVQQLSAYFKDKLNFFDLPLKPTVTAFQLSVLDALREIPFGKTETYSDIASKLDTGPRAVGNACRRNPVPLIIPCHRVIARNGLGGYSGARLGSFLTIKKWLLQHEA